MTQCINNAEDRNIGYYWERQFCIMAYRLGKCFTPHQWNKEKSALAFGRFAGLNKYTLPDITIWSAPGEHHEIKHKNPTKDTNMIGLELYRYRALYEFQQITQQTVYYTIHNHDLSGGRNSTENNIYHWFCGEIGADLTEYNAKKWKCNSWVNGEKRLVDTLFWNFNLFTRLAYVWRVQNTTLKVESA
jgi:hypothetical protein